MKINNLTNDQLCLIFTSKPEWMADYRPEWMANNRLDWTRDIPQHILDIIQ